MNLNFRVLMYLTVSFAFSSFRALFPFGGPISSFSFCSCWSPCPFTRRAANKERKEAKRRKIQAEKEELARLRARAHTSTSFGGGGTRNQHHYKGSGKKGQWQPTSRRRMPEQCEESTSMYGVQLAGASGSPMQAKGMKTEETGSKGEQKDGEKTMQLCMPRCT